MATEILLGVPFLAGMAVPEKVKDRARQGGKDGNLSVHTAMRIAGYLLNSMTPPMASIRIEVGLPVGLSWVQVSQQQVQNPIRLALS